MKHRDSQWQKSYIRGAAIAWTDTLPSAQLCTAIILNINKVPKGPWLINPYPTAFLYGNGMVLHFYQQQESSTTKTVHRVINKGLKAYV